MLELRATFPEFGQAGPRWGGLARLEPLAYVLAGMPAPMSQDDR